MQTFLFIILILAAYSKTIAQISAFTETGDEVLLYEDGTWKYAIQQVDRIPDIPVNPDVFERHKDASFLVKSKFANVGIWIDPKEWKFSKANDSEDVEYNFNKKGEDIYGILISERIPMPLETLKEIALQNARNAGSNFQIVKEEFRNVNGLKVLMLQMTGNIQGIEFHYYGYYYSDESGTVQLLTFTGKHLFDRYEKEMQQFLNGLTAVR